MTDDDRARDPYYIGSYRIKRELGRGVMGVVYLAWRSDNHLS